MRFRSLVLATAILAAAAVVALPGAASAAPPIRETVQLTRILPAFHTCDGFLVKAIFDLTREITTFTDEAGTPIARHIHVTANGVLSNSVTGYSLPSNGVRIFKYDLLTGELFTTGSNTVIHQPEGGGNITLGTGRLQFDATGQIVGYSGPTDDAEYAALCAALS